MRRVDRVAVLPVENLTGSADAAWASELVFQALIAHTAGGKDTLYFAANDDNDARRRRAAALLQGYLAKSGGDWEFRGSLREMGGTVRRQLEARSPSLLTLTEAVARGVVPEPASFTKNDTAAEVYVKSALQRDPAAAMDSLRKAAALDPDFGQPYFIMARRAASTGDNAGAMSVLAEALGAGHNLNPIVRAQLEQFRASLANDTRAQVAATATLARLMPADAEVLAQYGNLLAQQGDMRQASIFYTKALESEPESQALLNETTYVRLYAGETDRAIETAHAYDRVSGQNPNATDSLSEVYFAVGRFGDAAKGFLEVYRRDASFLGSIPLRKAALAALMAGDRNAANQNFQRFADAVAQNSLAEVWRAQWTYIADSPEAGVRKMRDVAAARNECLAWAQLAVWETAAGQDGRAAADKALQAVKNPVEQRAAAVAWFVAQPDAGAEGWIRLSEEQMARRVDVRTRLAGLAYAMMIHKQYATAIPILNDLLRRTRAIEGGDLRYLLGWAKLETGAQAEAKDLLRLLPLPKSRPDELFEFLMFPRSADLRKRAGW